MIIQLQQEMDPLNKENILQKIHSKGYSSHEVKTQKGDYIIGTGKSNFDIREMGQMPGIKDIHIVSDNYQLVSKKWKVEPSSIELGNDITIKQGKLSLMAGPCSIESEEQIDTVLKHLSENGIKIMRGGVFKPRTSPYSFRGKGLDSLKLWHEMAQPYGIKIITEVMRTSQIEEMYDYVDIYQVGARNTQNFNLLDELGKVDKPVLIKRGISGTIDELLQSAEYVFSGGNEELMLCERGIRTYETASRNTLDLNAIPILKAKTHLPIIADPSHGMGIRQHVETMALASIMAGADGIIYETHPLPEQAFSDGQQTLNFSESGKMVERMKKTFELRQELY